MLLLRPEKPLVSEAIDQESFTTRGFHAFLPCRAAAVVPDPHLSGRDYPVTLQNCRYRSDLRISVSPLRGPVVLVDHSAKYLPALHRRVKPHDDRLVMIGWRCCRD